MKETFFILAAVALVGCEDGGKKTAAEAKAAIEEEFGKNPYRFLLCRREPPFFLGVPAN